jgi:hypothetical protein
MAIKIWTQLREALLRRSPGEPAPSQNGTVNPRQLQALEKEVDRLIDRCELGGTTREKPPKKAQHYAEALGKLFLLDQAAALKKIRIAGVSEHDVIINNASACLAAESIKFLAERVDEIHVHNPYAVNAALSAAVNGSVRTNPQFETALFDFILKLSQRTIPASDTAERITSVNNRVAESAADPFQRQRAYENAETASKLLAPYDDARIKTNELTRMIEFERQLTAMYSDDPMSAFNEIIKRGQPTETKVDRDLKSARDAGFGKLAQMAENFGIKELFRFDKPILHGAGHFFPTVDVHTILDKPDTLTRGLTAAGMVVNEASGIHRQQAAHFILRASDALAERPTTNLLPDQPRRALICANYDVLVSVVSPAIQASALRNALQWSITYLDEDHGFAQKWVRAISEKQSQRLKDSECKDLCNTVTAMVDNHNPAQRPGQRPPLAQAARPALGSGGS